MSQGLAQEEADESPGDRESVWLKQGERETREEGGGRPSSEGTGEPWERLGAREWFSGAPGWLSR